VHCIRCEIGAPTSACQRSRPHALRPARRKPWTSTASSRATRRRSASGAAGRRAGGAGAAPRRPSRPASPGPRGMLPAYGSSRWRRARGGSCWRPAGSLVATRAGAVWLASCAVCSLGKGVRGDEPCGVTTPLWVKLLAREGVGHALGARQRAAHIFMGGVANERCHLQPGRALMMRCVSGHQTKWVPSGAAHAPCKLHGRHP